ncbi:MAG: hypothetical protein E6G66_15620 [Actinobacteria bacterium]|nr:MAG: hypothetical protein E6G66_15620 [Actinomycetota bacterium]
MHEEESSRLEALVEAGIALAAESHLDTLLSRIADLARQVIRAAYGAVGVIGPRACWESSWSRPIPSA